MPTLAHFHPAVAAWFRGAFAAPTAAQQRAWPAIRSGRHALIAAPTGSGKTLAAFLAAIDQLVQRGLEAPLPDETAIVYVSPLKALSNDVRINLETPLGGIRAELARLGLPDVEIRTMVRTGDTPPGERATMRKRPPHIVVTTPESLYILLGSESGRRMLATTHSVIVDEIHALAPNKRGAHLALSLERLEALCGRRLIRVGLSATQKPIEEVARYLVGADRSAALAAAAPAAATPTETTPAATGPGASRGPAPFVAESAGDSTCEIVDVGYTRRRDLALEVPGPALEAAMSGDAWLLVYKRLAELAGEHRTTLLFVNTRRMAERAARHLSEILGKANVAAHHGSLSREHRLDAEQRLKRGELRVLVATASLELGIDIGDVDLVCQLGSPRSIAAFLQRVGRSGHAVGGTPKGRLFPLSRDDLVECAALLDAVRRAELDTLVVERNALDVLAQQIVAEVATRDWSEDELYRTLRRAYPYAQLARDDYTAIVRMLAEGFTTRRGARAAYLHRDAVHGMLRARRGARLTAITSGGAIPDTADYDVVLEPQAQTIGKVHEDFAVESLAGDIFQLGNASYRILRVERGRVRVEDAQGSPPSIPFWLGEAPGRSDELSHAVSRLRATLSERLERGLAAAQDWLVDEVGLGAEAARQLADYLGGARLALGLLPTQTELAMERFFDESGGTQLVIHSPYGSRLNRAWGLALRKRFCRTFNFELQAAATEDAIVLSLSTSHSFPLEDVARYLHSNTVRDVLVQALLDAPMFPTRWRWNATTALALPRVQGGTKVAPQLQRMKSEDLLATVFPDQVACAENLVGEREIPDHPLVAQTLHDCLHEAMDLDGLVRLLQRLERGEARFVARDLTAPSPLAAEILGARPYAYLDDAPLEERRTQAVMSRRFTDPDSADDLGKLDPEAIEAVRAEAWPEARNADELHDALMGIAYLRDDEIASGPGWPALIAELRAARRVTQLAASAATAPDSSSAAAPRAEDRDDATTRDSTSTERLPIGRPGESRDPVTSTQAPGPGLRRDDGGDGDTGRALPGAPTGLGGERPSLWVCAERLPVFRALHPQAAFEPAIDAPDEYARVAWTREDALVDVVRARLTGVGPVRVATLAGELALAPGDIEAALLALEAEGYVMRGRFTAAASEIEWCERHLLARIHRYTVKRLRREIEPVEPRDFMRFLFEWQRIAPGAQVAGRDALAGVVAQLEGYEAPAGAWESEILPARVAEYDIAWLDELSMTGRVVWTRLREPAGGAERERVAGPVRTTPIVLLQRRHLGAWTALGARGGEAPRLSSRAGRVADWLREHGASFFEELAGGTRLLRAEIENALGELVAAGLVNADSFAGLRALLVRSSRRPAPRRHRGRRPSLFGIEDAGRWALIRRSPPAGGATTDGLGEEAVEHVARVLLRRYGVVFWRLLEREAPWLPPWRELRRVYHRLEARGEIRGGRFIAGISGEHFALPEAVGLLRGVRQKPHDQTWVGVSGADPLNLVGIVLPGSKVPAVAAARVLYCDGVPLATLIAKEVVYAPAVSADQQWAVRNRLLRHAPAELPAGVAS
jgi:ATP-dependent Lhr-like helicase